MRRKRLQHAADNLCQMFCGWQQIWSKHRLVELGSGELEIGVLSGTCRFNGAEVEALPIVAVLGKWLREDLERHHIPESGLLEATVRASLTFDLVPWESRTTTSEFFWHSGEPAKSDPMHRCSFECFSLLRTDEAQYEGRYAEVEEWPVGWPAA
jgi:hypothetical protein